MKLTEAQAKSLLADRGVPVPRSAVATTPDEAATVAERLGGPVAVKAQVRSGGRGKAGGVVVVGSPAEAAEAAQRMLGSRLGPGVGPGLGTGVGEETVAAVLVEEAVEIAVERYLSVVVDTSLGRPILMRSDQGGMEIESLSEAIEVEPIDPLTRGPADGHGFSDPIEAAVVAAFFELDALVVEINPLVETVDGSIMAVDAKIELDDSSAVRHPDLHERFDPGPDRFASGRERAAADLGLRLIELGGEVAVLANGAGLTMATMDAIVAAGGRPANFLEIGGDSYTKATTALELVLSQPGVTSLLVNFCGAFARCDVMTAGVVEAWKKLRPDIPVAFSIAGTGQDEARALLAERLGFQSHPSMASAVEAAVAATPSGRVHSGLPSRPNDGGQTSQRQGVKRPAIDRGAGSGRGEGDNRNDRGVRRETLDRGAGSGRGDRGGSPLFVTREHRVLVHGVTGRQGTFWTERMRDYGTNVVGGVSPTRARAPDGSTTSHLGLAVHGSAAEAAGAGVSADVSVLFVPPAAVAAGVADAVNAGIRLIVVLTEFVPVADTMVMMAMAREAGCTIVGPNTAGIVNPGQTFIGFMPAFDPRIFSPGGVGIVSRSGSLGTLAAVELTRAGFGQSAFFGVGGDPVSGTSTAEAVAALDADPETDAIVVIGEIGGRKEEDAAEVVARSSKPVVSFIAGAASPPGERMGHAGAIVEGSSGTYESKRRALEEAGAVVVEVASELPGALAEQLRVRAG